MRVALMFRMNGTSRYESTDGLGRAKQDAQAESTWMCDAKPLGGHICSSKGMLCKSDTSRSSASLRPQHTVYPEHNPHPSFNLTAPVGWVTCYPPMVLTSDDGPVRNGLRTLRSLRRAVQQLPANRSLKYLPYLSALLHSQ
jgi:hypothetical protein